MNIKDNTFAHACFEQNSIQELEKALNDEADIHDMKAWGITAKEWRQHIKSALDALKEL